MLLDFRAFESSQSAFWIDFLARHFGGSSGAADLKADKYWRLRRSNNWIVYYSFDLVTTGLAVLYLCVLCLA